MQLTYDSLSYHPVLDKLLKCLDRWRSTRLVYVRMPNNATRGIPAWMFDETICARRYCADVR